MAQPKPLLKPLAPATTAARLWKAGRFIDDPWRTILDSEPLPIRGHAIVSITRWRAARAALPALDLVVGIIVQPFERLDEASDDVSELGVIAVAFPKFSDGRAYSIARRLHEQWDYTGEIRATGDVLLDQIPLMLRAGFDAFEIVDAATVKALRDGHLPMVTRVYQPLMHASARFLGRARARLPGMHQDGKD